MVDREGGLVWSGDKKASLFSPHFDDKQCKDSFQLLHFSDSSPVLCFVAFQYNSICSLLMNLDLYSGNPDGMFPLFFKQLTREFAPKLAVIFRQSVKGRGEGKLPVF